MFDFTTATPQERAILMCIERIERLETLEDRIRDLEEECRQTYIRDIISLSVKEFLVIDIFAYLCGVAHEIRQSVSLHQFVYTYFHTHVKNIPQRARDLFALLKKTKEPWNITVNDRVELGGTLFKVFEDDTEYGTNIHAVLQAMTYEELKGYWTYRLKWTRCIDDSKDDNLHI